MANTNDLFSVATGYFGSAYLDATSADEEVQNLTTDSDHHCVAITMLDDCTFTLLTAFRDSSRASAYAEINGSTAPGFGKSLTTSDTFPKGVTIYGRWTAVKLNTGKCMVYVAPASGAHPGLTASAS
jgi:hypothetical protein|tara:strand:+ start:1184 stop:1564 length:381 start_codon:yes stop_codon:yes gene_type:complete